MNKPTISILICFLLGTLSVFAAGEFEQANRQFKAGDFAGAAATYEKILDADGPRASVYYNLGNSYQNLKQYGPAILAYERARLITPRDPDLLANLALARKAAAAFEQPRLHPRLDAALNFLSRNEWSWLVVASSWFLGGLSVLCGALRLPRREVRKAALGSACLAGALIATGATALYLLRDEASRGVVLTENAAIHLSPFEKAESLGTPGPGKGVRMSGTNGGFHYVEVPGTNLRGWLPDKEVAAIIPQVPGK